MTRRVERILEYMMFMVMAGMLLSLFSGARLPDEEEIRKLVYRIIDKMVEKW